MSQLRAIISRTEEIKKITLKRYGKELSDVNAVLSLLFPLSDLGEEIVRSEGTGEVMHITNRLILLEAWSFTNDVLHGTYWGAYRSLRWILEATSRGYAAIIDASILGKGYNGTMNYKQFYNYLIHADQNPRQVRGVRKIIDYLDEPDTTKKAMKDTYIRLCKQVHLSIDSFKRLEKRNFFAKAQLLPDEFEKTRKLWFSTMDSTLYLLCKGYSYVSKLDSETTGFFKNFPSADFPKHLRKRLPLLIKYLNEFVKK